MSPSVIHQGTGRVLTLCVCDSINSSWPLMESLRIDWDRRWWGVSSFHASYGSERWTNSYPLASLCLEMYAYRCVYVHIYIQESQLTRRWFIWASCLSLLSLGTIVLSLWWGNPLWWMNMSETPLFYDNWEAKRGFQYSFQRNASKDLTSFIYQRGPHFPTVWVLVTKTLE